MFYEVYETDDSNAQAKPKKPTSNVDIGLSIHYDRTTRRHLATKTHLLTMNHLLYSYDKSLIRSLALQNALRRKEMWQRKFFQRMINCTHVLVFIAGNRMTYRSFLITEPPFNFYGYAVALIDVLFLALYRLTAQNFTTLLNHIRPLLERRQQKNIPLYLVVFGKVAVRQHFLK